MTRLLFLTFPLLAALSGPAFAECSGAHDTATMTCAEGSSFDPVVGHCVTNVAS